MLVIMMGFTCLGAHFVMFPGVILKVFGIKAGAQLYSIMYTSYSISSVVGMIFYKTMSHYFNEKANLLVFNIAIGLILTSASLLFLVFEEKPLMKGLEDTKTVKSEMGLL